jgi:hypothetical protein
LDGNDPYGIRVWHGQTLLPIVNRRFFYPLPAVALALPFSWLAPNAAAVCFVVASAALLGYAITRDGFDRVPLLLSVPFLGAAQFAQSTIAIVAFALIPAAAGFAFLKPNVGIALFAWRPSWWAGLTAAALFVGSVAIVPDWPAHWFAVVRNSPAHQAPVMIPGGFLVLICAIKWRRPETRLLLLMALIPHGLYFYDELPLLLIAQSRREAMLLAIASWLGLLLWMATSPGPDVPDMKRWVVWTLYLPAAAMVLTRPNEQPAAVVPIPSNR